MPTNAESVIWKSIKNSISILALSIGISLFTAAYESSVIPLFASIPTLKYLDRVVHTSTALAVITPKFSNTKILLILGFLLLLAPYTSYWVSVHAARFRDPIYSPLLVHVLVLAPIVYFAVSLAMSIDPRLSLIVLAANALQLRPLLTLMFSLFSFNGTPNNITFIGLGCVPLAVYAWMQVSAGRNGFHSNTRYTGLKPLALGVISLVFAAILYYNPILWAPTLVDSISTPYNKPTYPLRILNSTRSKTGVVVVGEILPQAKSDSTSLHSIRYLRVSHSLLGGVWIGGEVATLDDFPPLTDTNGTLLGDSIYSTFVLQEAARLANHGKGDRNHALIIGLGTGISANAFARHKMKTTILEIDPAVYHAARQYFGLSDPGSDNVFLQDAREWVRTRRAAIEAEGVSAARVKYDVVVHDCFSGGGVPEHLFSIEFWNDLKTILSSEGVVAVNFAGQLASDSSRAVLATLLQAFGQCRAFHDLAESTSQDQLHSHFINMVFFCSPSPLPLTFRPSVEEDYLHSYLRRYVLSGLEKREIQHSQIRGSSVSVDESFILTDANNTLNKWQEEEALEHWKIMREIVPDVVWETY